MTFQRRVVYSETHLRQLWAAGKTHLEIAGALGCSELYVCELRKRHKLPRRRRTYAAPQDTDPTPEEIAQRAAECRVRHLEQRRQETREATVSKRCRQDVTRLPSIRVYGWDGFAFHSA